ncbi:aminoglycoside phosphotransferase family protein [Tamlana agarivorans]|uniref:Aminoglycoside phosphotransferase family protein n=1 Tax=Pseudotamlana agarivorans TaxID=481183 RepID=A0ACC5U4T2_9FLAO|nr:aminoglycoside phosphotransferase family protein [Tamlana agarivorans]MBU2949302.1 aminoglycoside phosphotransferase family protein [Tamlana agarivorans]
MTQEQLIHNFNQFNHLSEYSSHRELVSGHINDTFLVKTNEEPFYILQRINHFVFKDVPGLISNKVSVSKHIQKKLAHLSETQLNRFVLTFVQAKNGNYYYKDENGNYWNVMIYIKDSVTHDIVTDKEVAYEGGKLFGDFLNLTNDFDASVLSEVIPKFHDMSFRYSQFQSALQSVSKARLFKAKSLIDRVVESKEEMHILQNLKETGAIKLRVTHNDTKISNALFTKDNKGLCVIDTDTIMPGIVHYDFGDAIRTICNSTAEDESNLDLVEFNVEYYNAYKKGFLEKIEASLTPLELKYLPLGAKTMIFIMGIRFLNDYMNNDIYYKTKYPDHNLDRAKNQFKLIDSMMAQMAV